VNGNKEKQLLERLLMGKDAAPEQLRIALEDQNTC